VLPGARQSRDDALPRPRCAAGRRPLRRSRNGSHEAATGQLIAAGTRLVVFTDERGVLPWHHYVWDYASETPYSFETPADLSCAPNRGDPAQPLFILNHFLTQVLGSPQLAEQINHDPLFIERALACQAERSRLPNFVTVDFYDIGDVFPVTTTLNGLAP
jgi:hypothetical protein